MAQYPVEKIPIEKVKRTVDVVHGSVCGGFEPGTHKIVVSKTGGRSPSKRTRFKGTFAQAVAEGKRQVLKLGDGAHLWTHGASENTADYLVYKGRLHSATLTVLKSGGLAFIVGRQVR